MSGQPRALVIGGSVGGLFAAHMLRSIGWDVVVFERSGDDLARRGAGIGASDAISPSCGASVSHLTRRTGSLWCHEYGWSRVAT